MHARWRLKYTSQFFSPFDEFLAWDYKLPLTAILGYIEIKVELTLFSLFSLLNVSHVSKNLKIEDFLLLRSSCKNYSVPKIPSYHTQIPTYSEPSCMCFCMALGLVLTLFIFNSLVYFYVFYLAHLAGTPF